MGKQKGRKHRRVNRTPRPVGPSVTGRTGPDPRPAPGDEREPDLDKVLKRLGYKKREMPAQRSETVTVDRPEPAGPVFFNKARDGGLGPHAQRTWNQLRSVGSRGADVAELCEAVGYTPRTITKHLQGLAGYGLAVQGAGNRWTATGRSQWDAAREHGLPEAGAGVHQRAGLPV